MLALMLAELAVEMLWKKHVTAMIYKEAMELHTLPALALEK